MKTFEELDRLFGKSEQAFLVTELPFSEEAVLIYGNAAAAALTGINMREAAGRRFLDLGDRWKEERHIYHSVFADGLCLVTVMDRTESERAVTAAYVESCREMEKALAAANDANQAKTKFLSEMSHDIRTPMNAILGMTDIALKYVGDSVRVEDCLKKIRVASGHLMGLINEVLDMSRIESGKLTLTLEDFQLVDLIHSIMIVIISGGKEGDSFSSGNGRNPAGEPSGRCHAHPADLYQPAVQRGQVHGGWRRRVHEAAPGAG